MMSRIVWDIEKVRPKINALGFDVRTDDWYHRCSVCPVEQYCKEPDGDYNMPGCNESMLAFLFGDNYRELLGEGDEK